MTTNGTEPVPQRRVVPTTNGSEERKERGVRFRVLVYVVVAHVMALYLWLMFAVVGKH
ncbi:DUF6126 family protein [Actinacidiphila rubida]|uniref:Uncharacterized protein n=1 Tax=Actinacidiphila rubida TaxID=310780 RepID=A0A1H8UCU0_9ACTN|nr:DUF6126 family protein [Actinacidiphila rubida]SEP01015.1 hypothetical protein SAMN05216267_106915 [Actinacidiphila rubida]